MRIFYLTSFLVLLCISQSSESESLTRIDFYTTPRCPNSNGTWCVRAYHLHHKYFYSEFNNLGITDIVCSSEDDGPTFHYTALMPESEIPFYREGFVIHVGFRHNCTHKTHLLDYLLDPQWVKPGPEPVNITTTTNLTNMGKRTKKHDWDWWYGHFQGRTIGENKFYTRE